MIGRRFKGAFEPGFPEMTEADWASLERSHQEKAKQWEREKAEFRRQQQREWDEEDREFRERERRLMQRTRRELGLASEIVRIAKSLIAASSLDGMNRARVVRKVNEVLSRHTKGFFKDEDWSNVKKIWDDLTREGITYYIVGAEYQKDDRGVPTSKTWKFYVEWNNDKGRRQELHGVVVAAGAGTVEDPLGRYDLVAYVS